MFQPSFRSEKVTNLHIKIISLLVCLGYTRLQTPKYVTGVLHCDQLYDKCRPNSRMEGKSPTEMKRWVVKWQRALLTPFRGAAALEAVPLQLVSTLFTGKKKTKTKKQYDLRTSYTHEKGNSINTVNLLFKQY